MQKSHLKCFSDVIDDSRQWAMLTSLYISDATFITIPLCNKNTDTYHHCTPRSRVFFPSQTKFPSDTIIIKAIITSLMVNCRKNAQEIFPLANSFGVWFDLNQSSTQQHKDVKSKKVSFTTKHTKELSLFFQKPLFSLVFFELLSRMTWSRTIFKARRRHFSSSQTSGTLLCRGLRSLAWNSRPNPTQVWRKNIDTYIYTSKTERWF